MRHSGAPEQANSQIDSSVNRNLLRTPSPSGGVLSQGAQGVDSVDMMACHEVIRGHFLQRRILEAFRGGKGAARAEAAALRRVEQAGRHPGDGDELRSS